MGSGQTNQISLVVDFHLIWSMVVSSWLSSMMGQIQAGVTLLRRTILWEQFEPVMFIKKSNMSWDC